MTLTVRKAVRGDLPALLAIYENARRFMQTHGNRLCALRHDLYRGRHPAAGVLPPPRGLTRRTTKTALHGMCRAVLLWAGHRPKTDPRPLNQLVMLST